MRFIWVCLMGVVSAVLVIPMIWLLSASFQGSGQIFSVPFHWIPQEWRFDNYSKAWIDGGMSWAFLSSVKTALLATIVHVFYCTLVGYVLVKYKFKFQSGIITLFMLTLMIPQQITYFTVYDYARDLHLIDTNAGMALPFFINGVGTFMMMQFARYIPNEIIESARIDGATNWGIFFKMAVPLMKSGMAALAILMFSFIWDEFPWAKLIVNGDRVRTLPLTLTNFLNKQSTTEFNLSVMLAGCVMSFAPILLVFLMFQRQFIESVSHSGVKG